MFVNMKKLFSKIPKKGKLFPNILFGNNVKYSPLFEGESKSKVKMYFYRLYEKKIGGFHPPPLGNRVNTIVMRVLTNFYQSM